VNISKSTQTLLSELHLAALASSTHERMEVDLETERGQRRDRILRFPEVKSRVGYERTWIFRLEKAGKFPKRVSLGPKSVGWLESEIDAWISDRASARAN
jgi:prophage regulatory protein